MRSSQLYHGDAPAGEADASALAAAAEEAARAVSVEQRIGHPDLDLGVDKPGEAHAEADAEALVSALERCSSAHPDELCGHDEFPAGSRVVVEPCE